MSKPFTHSEVVPPKSSSTRKRTANASLNQGIGAPPEFQDWAVALAQEARAASNLTVGLLAGSREGNDPRTVEVLLGSLAEHLLALRHECRSLLIRLEIAEQTESLPVEFTERIPLARKSPLGPWSEVSIPMNSAPTSPWRTHWKPSRALAQMSDWIPIWKDAFRLIVIDMGSISHPASRAIGRLCDGSYILLGPGPCGSEEWIMQQLAWHSQHGSTICGTLVANISTGDDTIAMSASVSNSVPPASSLSLRKVA